MFNMITLDLSGAVGPIQVHRAAVARLRWKTSRHGFALASLLTEGPKHVVLIEVSHDVAMTKIVDELKIWWEHSVVLVLNGLIENHWRKKVGNAGVYGWQRIGANELAIVPPEASHARYNVRHGEDWVDPSRVEVKADSLLLLAAAGVIAEPREHLLRVNLEDYLDALRVKPAAQPLRALGDLGAEALCHRQGDGVAAGIYRHYGMPSTSFAHGMISLSLACGDSARDGDSIGDCVLPSMTIAGPKDRIPAPAVNSWSLDAMFF